MAKAKKKKRGVMSVRCPRCNGISEVYRTFMDDKVTVRERTCAKGHKFRTKEKVDGKK